MSVRRIFALTVNGSTFVSSEFNENGHVVDERDLMSLAVRERSLEAEKRIGFRITPEMVERVKAAMVAIPSSYRRAAELMQELGKFEPAKLPTFNLLKPHTIHGAFVGSEKPPIFKKVEVKVTRWAYAFPLACYLLLGKEREGELDVEGRTKSEARAALKRKFRTTWPNGKLPKVMLTNLS
jgi:hypothetical protein